MAVGHSVRHAHKTTIERMLCRRTRRDKFAPMWGVICQIAGEWAAEHRASLRKRHGVRTYRRYGFGPILSETGR